MTSRSTASLTSANRDLAAVALGAGQVSYPARSSVCPSKKANPKSSSTIRTVFTCLNLRGGSRKLSNRLARSSLYCYQTLAKRYRENLRRKVEAKREKGRKLASKYT